MSNRSSKQTPRLSKVRKADPMLQRELETYDVPLPSREYVLQVLAERGVPLSFTDLVGALDIQVEEEQFFQRRLGAMARDGQLMQNRKGDWLVPDKANLIPGKVEGHADGFGFLVPDDGTPDLFLSAKEMEKVLHGDRAIACVIGVDRRGRPEGKLVEVLERANTKLVGRVFNEHGLWFVKAENKRISQDILLSPVDKANKTLKPKDGQVVMIEIIEQPAKNSQPIGRLIEILGNYADPGMEIEIALRKHDLPFEFSKGALDEAKKLPDVVRPEDWKDREDITKLPLVTIDGETARDFDDAVYSERIGKGKTAGYRLIVAIADVSHYVKENGALDVDAYARGNSVYFPRRVIPMLPEKISNGLCSLNPQVERLCLVCDMELSATGEVKRYRFYSAVMFSHARLTYTEVAAALYEKDPATRTKLAALLPHLENLDTVYRLLAQTRSERGAIDFESTETRMNFNENGKIESIEPYERNEAHRVIEECMLAANVCASAFLADKKHPCLYRVHEGPSAERLKKLRDFLGTFGLQLTGGDEPKAKDYATLITKIKGRPDTQLLQIVMLRSLRQAIYSPDNLGHFGLAYESYTHFTSPIRRYPDLVIHRSIKATLAKKQYKPKMEEGDWEQIGLHCSMTERRADDATRDVEAWLKCFYMQDRIGEIFTGSIASVVHFGIFVALDQVYVEGLVHVSELGSDYFHFDESAHAMVGERTGKRYRLSDRVRVQLVRVDMETNKIDFRLADETQTGPSAKIRPEKQSPYSRDGGARSNGNARGGASQGDRGGAGGVGGTKPPRGGSKPARSGGGKAAPKTVAKTGAKPAPKTHKPKVSKPPMGRKKKR